MRSVLGIDAAWTEKKPSGVALVAERSEGWTLVALACSYSSFHTNSGDRLAIGSPQKGTMPDAAALIASCELMCGARPDLIAIDMPLSFEPITKRRASDNAVTVAYGGRWCGTHSPNINSPGKLSDDLREGFEKQDYPLRTTDPLQVPGLIEVYPHPALLELAGESRRLPYKSSKTRNYWPHLSAGERRKELHEQWEKIANLLD